MIAAALQTVSQKLSAATPRERAGLSLLAAIAAITAAIYAVDWANTSAREAETATQASADAMTLEAAFADEGYRRLLASETGKVWRWSRGADAFAGEEVLTELEALAAQSGFGDVSTALVEAEPQRGRVSALYASVEANFDWGSFLSLLEAFEAAELSYVVRSIDISEGDGVQRMTLVVSVPVINGEDAQ